MCLQQYGADTVLGSGEREGPESQNQWAAMDVDEVGPAGLLSCIVPAAPVCSILQALQISLQVGMSQQQIRQPGRGASSAQVATTPQNL